MGYCLEEEKGRGETDSWREPKHWVECGFVEEIGLCLEAGVTLKQHCSLQPSTSHVLHAFTILATRGMLGTSGAHVDVYFSDILWQ